MKEINDPVYYGDYLGLGVLLSTQNPKSKEHGNEAHDETLFIIVHQVYELWFKQILHELYSIRAIFKDQLVEERKLSTVTSRLDRIKRIQSLLIDQFDVMESMTPMDFLEFRDLLVPASGFQSVQFREIEIIFGLHTHQRKVVDSEFFLGRLNKIDQERLLKIAKDESLLVLMGNWLERMPFTFTEDFDFWGEYKRAVDVMLLGDENTILNNKACLSKKALDLQMANLDSTRKTFSSLFDSKIHKKLMDSGERKLSQKAILNALFILLYRDEPILHLPFKILENLMDIDENFTAWRYRHAIMAQRMLGTKIGTGGSSGHEYLKMAAENNRFFSDIFNLSTFLIPTSRLPVLPEKLKEKMNFNYRG